MRVASVLDGATGLLFPEERLRMPAGFRYWPDFLALVDERELLEAVGRFELKQFEFRGYTAKRQTARFGIGCNIETGELKQDGPPIPQEFRPLIDRVARHLVRELGDPVRPHFPHLLLTYYPSGSVINWHRDAGPFAMIAGISLGAPVEFRLRPWEREQRGRGRIVTTTLRPRSLYLMSGEARSRWQHSTAPVIGERWSITLRTLRPHAGRGRYF